MLPRHFLLLKCIDTTTKAIFSSLFLFALQACYVTPIAHDSLHCAQTGTCEEPHHLVLKLNKRDDSRARQIAAEHDLELKVFQIHFIFVLLLVKFRESPSSNHIILCTINQAPPLGRNGRLWIKLPIYRALSG